MALWTNTSSQNHDVYTVVYLLNDAVKSALSDAFYLERTALPKAEMKGAGHAEIAARLGRFRDSCNNFREREAMMLAKLLRARKWALELKRLAPEFQEEIDQFLDTTEPCEEVKSEFLKDAQRMFHGGGLPSRFIAQRKPESLSLSEAKSESRKDVYMVWGGVALYELRAACEVFLE